MTLGKPLPRVTKTILRQIGHKIVTRHNPAYHLNHLQTAFKKESTAPPCLTSLSHDKVAFNEQRLNSRKTSVCNDE